jgi:subtilisin family serine protease
LPPSAAAVEPPDAGPPRLVALKVGKGESAAQLAAHVARMNEVEYAFVPPVRRLFARRKKAGVDPLASRQWGHGAIRLGHARAARGFKNATTITIAVVDSGIDTRHPDLKQAIAGYKNFLRGSDKDFVGHGTHVAGIIAATAGNGLASRGVRRPHPRLEGAAS